MEIRHIWLGILGLALLVWGCGGSARQVAPEQFIVNVQTSKEKNLLQEKLMTQANRAMVSGYRDYKVGPEDLLEVTFFGQDELYREVRINGQGDIDMPLVGAVKVGDLSPHQVSQKLAELYREERFIKNPQINVVVKEYRHQRVAVSGAVSKPDFYEIIGPRSLLEILGMAGGVNDKAGDMIHVIRKPKNLPKGKVVKVAAAQSFSPGYETIVIELKRLVNEGSLDLNIPIKNGDVVYVPFAKNAYVLGAVKRAGSVPVKDDITVTQAVAMAGGGDIQLASSKVSVIRFNDSGERISMALNLKRVRQGIEVDPPLLENDIVFVHESPVRRFFFDIKSLNPFGGSVMSVIPY